MKRAKIFYRKTVCKFSTEVRKYLVISNEHNIIYIDHEVTCDIIMIVDEKRGVCHGFAKTKGDKKLRKLHVPCSKSLFGSIQRFSELANVVWELRMDEAGWLGHEYFLVKCVMKKMHFLHQIDGVANFWKE